MWVAMNNRVLECRWPVSVSVVAVESLGFWVKAPCEMARNLRICRPGAQSMSTGCYSHFTDSGFQVAVEFECHSISADSGIWLQLDTGFPLVTRIWVSLEFGLQWNLAAVGIKLAVASKCHSPPTCILFYRFLLNDRKFCCSLQLLPVISQTRPVHL